jgi:DNA-binding MarR family transcriptional regulator
MNDQIRQLAGLIEDMMYDFSAHNLDSECCENISHGEYRALRALARVNMCAMQDIAKNISVTKSGATRIIGRLEEKNLVQRVQNQNDGRVCCVQLSKEGKKRMSEIVKRPEDKIMTVLTAMDQNMRQILLISLNAFFQIALDQTAKSKIRRTKDGI